MGKHVTVNQMVAKESVRARMESDTGISYTEFSYSSSRPTTSAGSTSTSSASCRWAARTSGATSSTGIDLIRKRGRRHRVRPDLAAAAEGRRREVREVGRRAAVWLDPGRTSPYQFRQFLVQIDDADVERQLLRFTLLPVAEIEELMVAHRERTRAARGPAGCWPDG